MIGRRLGWAERLLVRANWLLILGLASVVLTMALSLYLARDDGLEEVRMATGETATAGGGTFRIERMYRSSVMPGNYQDTQPVEGATFVIVEVAADLSKVSPEEYCSLRLTAGEYAFDYEFGLKPSNPDFTTSCVGGSNSTITYAYQVPLRLLDQVDGVRVDINEDGRYTSTRLRGSLR